MLEILNGLGWLTAIIVYCYMESEAMKQRETIRDQQGTINRLVRGVDSFGNPLK
jgi:hypothetical protein